MSHIYVANWANLMKIDVSPIETIWSIESRLTTASTQYSSWFHSLHKPSHCFSSLRGNETITSIGAGEHLILYAWIHVLGGSQISTNDFLDVDHLINGFVASHAVVELSCMPLHLIVLSTYLTMTVTLPRLLIWLRIQTVRLWLRSLTKLDCYGCWMMPLSTGLFSTLGHHWLPISLIFKIVVTMTNLLVKMASSWQWMVT